MFKKTCLVLSVALLVLTACSSGGGGGGGQTNTPPTVPPTITYKIPDTGQTTSYTTTFGEDSDYPYNPPSYTVDSTKKTVFDKNTELMWEQLPDAGDHSAMNHADAITHCGAQTTGEYSDWRLPSIDELETITNLGRQNPAIDRTAFPNTKSLEYWSSSIYADNTSDAWYLHFVIGLSRNGGLSNRYYVRCVRLSPAEPEKRFTDNGDKTITDQKTKLMWEQLPDAADHTTDTWEAALKHCEGLTFAGHNNWRLPNKKELLSIADRSRSGPAIDTTAFPNTRSSKYWASTINADYPSAVLKVDFNDGNSSGSSRSGNGYARCVRTPSMPRVPLYKVPDTGQTTGYTDTFGEDADYTINPPSYTVDSTKKTVFDNNTRLMWEQLPTSGDHVQRTHANAITYCEARTTGGYSDWRLPSIDELETIAKLEDLDPAIDTTAFPNTKSLEYWSSSIYADNTSDAWYLDFVIGLSGSESRTSSFYVRCVRLSSANPAKRFTNNGNKTITDQKTGLIWQQLPDAGDHTTRTWEDSLEHCEDLSLAGHSDWRLPNRKELFSIADRSRSAPAIDPSTFPNTKSSGYWSSSIRAGTSSFAWGVNFNKGNSFTNGRTTSGYARCVR